MRIIRDRVVALGLAFLMGCARMPAGDQGSAAIIPPSPAFVDQREMEMGTQIHQAIVSSFRVYTEPRVVGYVSGLGRSIAGVSHRKDLSYQFTILYDPRVYATEAPGGFVYITTGFLNFLQNEAELAALLAGEVALLQFRDRRFSKSKRALRMAAQGGAVVAPFFGPFGSLAATGLVLLNAFSESREPNLAKKIERADRMALQYLAETGQDPQGHLDLLSRLLNPDPAWRPYLHDYLTSHPVTLDRLERSLGEFEKLPLEGKSFDVNRERYLEMTRGVREIYRG